jgi:hypothetical protein
MIHFSITDRIQQALNVLKVHALIKSMAFIEEQKNVLAQLPTHHKKIWYETITQTHERTHFQTNKSERGFR